MRDNLCRLHYKREINVGLGCGCGDESQFKFLHVYFPKELMVFLVSLRETFKNIQNFLEI